MYELTILVNSERNVLWNLAIFSVAACVCVWVCVCVGVSVWVGGVCVWGGDNIDLQFQ